MKLLSICGSPRKGNSEALLLHLKTLFEKAGIENEVILLREKNIAHCDGCTEYCNKELKCEKHDDMDEILEKMLAVDGYVFACPSYFRMAPGIFKDFIDRCSIFYTAKTDLSSKKTVMLAVGAGETSETDLCLNFIVKNFCEALGMNVVAKKSFKGKSDLNEDYENILTGEVKGELEKVVEGL
jgi:multimeric flavodoxin WrbA